MFTIFSISIGISAFFTGIYHKLTNSSSVTYYELDMTQTLIARGGVCEAHFCALFGTELNDEMYCISFYTTELESLGHDKWRSRFREICNSEPEKMDLCMLTKRL